MTATNSDFLFSLLQRLRRFREEAGYSANEVEQRLILGPGWVEAIENGSVYPSLDVVASLLAVYDRDLSDLTQGLTGSVPHINRSISCIVSENLLSIHFKYASHDAIYRLENATPDEFTRVILTLRNGLAQLSRQNIDPAQERSIKTNSVARAFLEAVEMWPRANPSDLWWFLIYRAYCDEYNHPSEHSRLDFTQSWKRTSGWALERILEIHYAATLAEHGICLSIADSERKARLLEGIDVEHRLETDKVDVVLTIGEGAQERLIGVVHVKASFAERRTDDVPMSQALVKAGYISPLWTMDCKSIPSASPHNRGELGAVWSGIGVDTRSAKRRDIEDDQFFSACFSYNQNTLSTPEDYKARGRIYTCNFSNPDDVFVEFIVAEAQRVRTMLGF
jgi:transcriptional regulator with XRE-family HTH domain